MNRPNLPVELVYQMLFFLDISDLLNCVAVNKFFRSLVRESSRLQFTLELGKYRMLSILSPAKFPPFSTRLKLIRERERRWRSPRLWGPLYELLGLPPTERAYEFVGGYYAAGQASGISFFQLPSAEPTTLDTPLKNWTHAMGGLTILDFTMDPAQDLLVVVALPPPQCSSAYQLHLRSFTTNKAHPESSLPTGILEFIPNVFNHVPLDPEAGNMRIQIAGDLIALLAKEVANRLSILHIWNWRYGSHYVCAMIRRGGIEDFTFLSNNTFLIVRPAGRFECYTFENPVSCSTVPLLKSIYDFPKLREGCLYSYIFMNSNPTLECIPSERAYYPHPNERILACCVNIFKPTGLGNHHIHSFVFFLNTKIFFDALASPTDVTAYLVDKPSHTTPAMTLNEVYRLSLRISSGVQGISWEDWGPRSTRWFDDTGLTDWQRALYGLKSVECIPNIKDHAKPVVDTNTTEQEQAAAVDPEISFDVTGVRESMGLQRHLRIRDYNPYSLGVEVVVDKGKVLVHNPSSSWDRRIVAASSTIRSSVTGVFVNDVVSLLPYSEVISKERYNVTDVMMDDCRVLLLQRAEEGKLKSINILTV